MKSVPPFMNFYRSTVAGAAAEAAGTVMEPAASAAAIVATLKRSRATRQARGRPVHARAWPAFFHGDGEWGWEWEWLMVDG
jgi:hypothetical protein